MKARSQTLRKQTLERDDFTCQKCKIQDVTGKLLEIHHINPLYSEGKDELSNLITLCNDCHHFAPDKEEEFKEYMKEEMTGTATTLMKSIEKVKAEHQDLFEKIGLGRLGRGYESLLLEYK